MPPPNRDNIPETPPPPPPGQPLVTDEAFGFANRLMASASLVMIPLICVFKKEINIEQGDIQTLTELVAAVGSIALAVPLFFKDVDRGTLFWKHFFFIAFCLILATLLAFFGLLHMKGQDSHPLTLHFFFFLLVVISFQCQAYHSWKRYFFKWRVENLNIELTLSFFGALILLLLAVFFSEGDRLLVFFLLLTFFGLYLIVIASFSLLWQITKESPTTPSPREQIKWAIQIVIEDNKHRAMQRLQLLSILRESSFSSRQEIVNETILNELLDEMDRETGPGPKISLKHYDAIIPRWNQQYVREVINSDPKIILYQCSSTRIPDVTELSKRRQEEILGRIAESSRLSLELLKDHEVLPLKFETFGSFSFFHQLSHYEVGIAASTDILDRLETLRGAKDIWLIKSAEDLFGDRAMYLDADLEDFEPFEITFQFLKLTEKIYELNTKEAVLSVLNYEAQELASVVTLLWKRFFGYGVVSKDLKDKMYHALMDRTDRILGELVGSGEVIMTEVELKEVYRLADKNT